VTIRAHRCEILILGAGPAGSTLAYLLAKAGRDVLLVDRYEFPRDKTCGDGLTPRATETLIRLGLPIAELPGEKVTAALLVSPRGTQSRLSFDALLGPGSFGQIVPRLELDAWLHGKAVAAGARFIRGVAQSLNQHGKTVTGATIKTTLGLEHINAGLTVVATGASSSLLKDLHLEPRLGDSIIAVRTYFQHVPPSEPAFEFYFDRDLLPGYGWVFPMHDGRANVGVGVYSRTLKERGVSINDLLDGFLHGATMQARLKGAAEAGPRRSHPLRIDFPSHATAGHGWIIVGESAGIVNPVTGEGIDLAIESAEIAAAEILAHNGKWPRRRTRRYERALVKRFANVFRGARLMQRLAMNERYMDSVVRRSLTHPVFARAALRINLGLVTPLELLKPRVAWAILGPKLFPPKPAPPPTTHV
jgi:geranylgeranyl reductase family protein